ncbi:hypothetical protein TKK_0015543 [Trichogramma kaykai]
MSPQPMCYTYDWPVPKSWKNAWEASGNVVLDNELPLLCSAHVDPPCGPFEKSYSQLYDKVIAHLVSKKIIDQWDKDDETEDAEEAQNDDQDPSDDEEHEEKAENEEDETRFDSISQRGFDNEENSLSLSPNSHLMESSRSQAVPVNLDTQHVSRNVVLNTDGQQLYQKLQSIPPEKDILIGGGYDGNENCNRDILNSQSTDLDMGSATVQDLNNAVLEGIKDYLGGDITNADDLLNNSDLLHNFESLAATGEFDPEGKEIIEGENESSVSAPTDPSQTARKSISPSPSVEEHEVMEKNDNIRVSRSNGEPPALDDGEDITTSTPNKDVFKAPVEKTVPGKKRKTKQTDQSLPSTSGLSNQKKAKLDSDNGSDTNTFLKIYNIDYNKKSNNVVKLSSFEASSVVNEDLNDNSDCQSIVDVRSLGKLNYNDLHIKETNKPKVLPQKRRGLRSDKSKSKDKSKEKSKGNPKEKSKE